ncbi:phosphorylcholine transferase LicD [Selenomonas sp. FC4001]|uniref:LicD family protein n=1 Tax=Selenomonas sp. FC4001 TaxID=1408313 RepID=UPI00068E5294|nr:LicD family protein [Selenomonas sp. FC4001]
MVNLTAEQLRAVQLIELEMLEEVDRICKKCGIRYNIIAGTLLGAVRHGGFIPWDDDADVALLRPEYEKFYRACQKELDTSRFIFQDYRNTPGYRWGYGKLRRKGTLFLREHQEHMPYHQGIFIDIFPLDNVPDGRWERIWHNFHCFCIRKVLWSEVGRVADKSWLMRKWYAFLSGIPRERIFKHYENFLEAGNTKNTKWVRILTFPTPNREYGYLRKWYEKSKIIEFEKKEFDGIYNYDEYLNFKFGNYMELPPQEQRKVHPVTDLKIL